MVGAVAFLLLMAKVASPFLHSHELIESSQKVTVTAPCNACEYEAMQSALPDVAVPLLVSHFRYEIKVYDFTSPFVSLVSSSSESRGPPQIS